MSTIATAPRPVAPAVLAMSANTSPVPAFPDPFTSGIVREGWVLKKRRKRMQGLYLSSSILETVMNKLQALRGDTSSYTSLACYLTLSNLANPRETKLLSPRPRSRPQEDRRIYTLILTMRHFISSVLIWRISMAGWPRFGVFNLYQVVIVPAHACMRLRGAANL